MNSDRRFLPEAREQLYNFRYAQLLPISLFLMPLPGDKVFVGIFQQDSVTHLPYSQPWKKQIKRAPKSRRLRDFRRGRQWKHLLESAGENLRVHRSYMTIIMEFPTLQIPTNFQNKPINLVFKPISVEISITMDTFFVYRNLRKQGPREEERREKGEK